MLGMMLIVGCLVVLNMITIIYCALRLRHLERKQRQELEALRKEFRIFTGSMTEVGCHLVEIEKQLNDMGEKQIEMADMAYQDGTEIADYDQAKRLAEMGADLQEIMSSCGLTRAEAELLERMQGRVAV